MARWTYEWSFPGLAPDDQAHLGVRLQPHHAVDHVDAGGFQRPRPADVVLLVEARLQLDQDRDLLAILPCLHQRLHHRRVGADAVEGLLDGDDVGIGRRLPEQPHHGREAVIGMVEKVVSPADRSEQGLVALERGVPHGPDGAVAKFRPVEEGDLAQVRQAEGRRQRVDLERRQPHVLLEQRTDPLRHVLAHLQADDGAEMPLAHDLDDRRQQVARLVLLKVQVGVAGHAEGVGGRDLHAREEQVEIGGNQLLHPDELAAAGLQAEFVPTAARRQHEPRQHLRHLQSGEALDLGGVLDDDRQVQTQVRDVGKRMTRIERERRQDREDVALEVGAELALLLGREVVVGDDLDPLVLELGQQVLVPAAVQLAPLALQVGADTSQLLRRRHPVRRRFQSAPFELPHQTRDTNHEELVQVAAVDRQELDPFEQRMPRIPGLFQDPAVEAQPAQLPVDVVLGKTGHDDRPARLHRRSTLRGGG